jgi:hypothetical protein
MSHVSEGACKILDLTDLETGAGNLGFELVRGKTTYTWFGKFLNDWNDPQRAAAMRGHNPETFGQCEHVLRRKDALPGDYEIGVVKARDGVGYELVYDSWGNGRKLEEKGGVGLTKIADEYNLARATRSLAKQGHRVRRVVTDSGQLQLIATKA